MSTLLRVTALSFLAVLFVLPLCVVAQDDKAAEAADDRPNEKVSDDQKAIASFVAGKLDGEQQMLVNGLRYLMRPHYEEEIMEGLAFEPCPLPSLDDINHDEMTLPETMRLWAFLQAGWPLERKLERELYRFVHTEHKRYNDSLAAYAVPMLVSTMALRRPEIAEDKDLADALREKAEKMMETGMNVRRLTAEQSPVIKGMIILPMWYGNQLWRILMARCAAELDIRYSRNVVRSHLKNLSHAAQKDLGWISTQGKAMTPDNDLNTNLLALGAITQVMASDDMDRSTKRSFSKRLKYLEEILSRLEEEWPGELRTGGRLCLVRTLDTDWAPEGVEPPDWRFAIRTEGVENMYASGAVHTDHTLVHDMGVFGRTNRGYAKSACETALACLSVCGGLYPEPEDEDSPERPLEGWKKDDLDMVMESFSLLHASVLPEKKDEEGDLANLVNEAIDRAANFLLEQQSVEGHFQGEHEGKGTPKRRNPSYTAAALHALMHAGYGHNHTVIERGMKWLRDHMQGIREGEGRGMNSYDAGIVLMMYERYYEWLMEKCHVFDTIGQAAALRARQNTWAEIRQVDKDIIEWLVKYLDGAYVDYPQGGWGYAPGISSTSGKAHSDNSISQFAACGYKSASLMGAPVDMEVFKNELRRLYNQYSPDKEFPEQTFERYEENVPEGADERYTSGTYADTKIWKRSIRPGGWGYVCRATTQAGPQYTGTGMAILAAAKDELWAHRMLGDDMHRMADTAIFGAQLWLALTGRWERRVPDAEPVVEGEEPVEEHVQGRGRIAGGIYNWYAIERGCVMAGYKIIGGDIDWYSQVARYLLDSQAEDGSWYYHTTELGTAWGILILRRAAPRTVTKPPADVDEGEPSRTGGPFTDREKFPITPGPVKPEKDQDEPEDEKENRPSPITPGPGDDD